MTILPLAPTRPSLHILGTPAQEKSRKSDAPAIRPSETCAEEVLFTSAAFPVLTRFNKVIKLFPARESGRRPRPHDSPFFAQRRRTGRDYEIQAVFADSGGSSSIGTGSVCQCAVSNAGLWFVALLLRRLQLGFCPQYDNFRYQQSLDHRPQYGQYFSSFGERGRPELRGSSKADDSQQ